MSRLAEENPWAIDANFRLQWQSKTARRDWIRITLVDPTTDARLSEIRNLSRSLAATGAYQLGDDGRTIMFRPSRPMQDGALEFRVRGSIDCSLAIQLCNRTKSRSARQCFTDETLGNSTKISVSNILDGAEYTPEETFSPNETSTDSGVSTWSLRRVANDEIRIDTDRDDALYPMVADANVKVRIRGCALVNMASKTEQLDATIRRIADDSVVARHSWNVSIDANGNFPILSWDPSLPKRPGVYEICCELKQRESKIWERIRRQDDASATAKRAIVVLPDPQVTPSTDAREWREIALIRPNEPARSGISPWLPGNNVRLNPLGKPVPENGLESQSYLGRSVAVLSGGEKYETILPTLAPGSPQKVTIRYPSARVCQLRVQVVQDKNRSSLDFLLAQETASVTDQIWSEHTFAYYPSKNQTRLRITNLLPKASMIESITVHAGPGKLSTSPVQNAGLAPRKNARDEWTTQPMRLATAVLPDLDWADSFTHDIDVADLSSRYAAGTVSLHQSFIGTLRLKNYLQLAGMNAVIVPAIDGCRAGCSTDAFSPSIADDRSDGSKLRLAFHLLESSSLRVFASVDLSTTLDEIESWDINQTTNQEPSIRGGKDKRLYNVLHPRVPPAMASVIQTVNSQLSDFRCFTGISLQCDDLRKACEESASLDPEAVARFATSPAVAGENIPTLPAQARAWVVADRHQRFAQWTGDQTCDFFGELAGQVDGITMLRSAAAVENQPFFDSLDRQSRLTSNGQIMVVHDIRRVPVGALPNELRFHRPSGVEASATAGTQRSSLGLCISDPQRTKIAATKANRTTTPPQPVLRNRTAVDLTSLFEHSDPSCLMFDGFSATTIDENLASLLRDWTSLPIEPIHEVTSPDPNATTAKLRFGRQGSRYFLMAINLAPWPSDVTVQTSTSLNWRQAGSNGAIGSRQIDPVVKNRGLRAEIRLQPRTFVVLQADTDRENVAVLDWFARVHGGKQQIDVLAGQVKKIVDRLGGLSEPVSYPSLTNGGFESESSVGLPGWLHAQHPPGAVRVDNTEAIEGKRSIVMTTETHVGDRTWLVSEMIQPPESGRLAVSLAARAERANSDTTHRLRVSIEGTRSGEPVRQSAEIDVPYNGKWQSRRLVLEVEGVDPSSVDMLRLTIDSLSRGRVWVDDIRLHDRFPLSKERDKLQGNAYVAVQGLQRGNLAPAARLIQNEWAQHLLAIDEPMPPAVVKSDPPKPEAPGVAERIRNWLPAPLRF